MEAVCEWCEVEAAVRRRRKNAKRKEEKEEKEEKESKEKKKAKEADPEGAKLECRKCGRVFKSNRGGWVVKHTVECAAGQRTQVVRVVTEKNLKCPKCARVFRSKAGGWFQKHIDECGSSQL